MASLYLHIPFCEHKCIYCDFYSVEQLQSLPVFIDALKKEIHRYRRVGGQRTFDTIFFGGGTPSLLTAGTVAGILDDLRSTFSISPDAEITLETNPGTVDDRKLNEFRNAGVNRLSIGIQSFHDEDLHFLTRIHSAAEAKAVVRLAQKAGFDNINVDLIFSLPGQTLAQWEDNLTQALALEIQHLSAYSLIVEPSTPLARMVQTRQVAPLPNDEDAAMYEFTMEFLSERGFTQYEISNYAREGFQCRHNLAYWSHEPYLGFGPSAHSFIDRRRWWNVASVQGYSDALKNGRLPVAGEETLTDEQLWDETIMLSLRMGEVDLMKLKEQTGFDLLKQQPAFLEDLLAEELAVLDAGRMRLTRKGMLVCDEISQRVLAHVSPA